ncbi:MAG: GTP cyclohydrolase I FolE [Firmicutes bacterium]|jgi:GTP cyclohydrolase I|nr:GTP cyclohydrolase I FolE [Bacillota bacterium]
MLNFALTIYGTGCCANRRDKHKLDDVRIMKAVREILEAIGEDPDREGLKDTPDRIARMFQEIFCGLGKDPREELTPVFNEEHEEMVIIKDIPFYSMCEHHLLPFHGKAHVAYLPKGGRVVGLSKLARVVEILARRPQLQERLTSEVADMIFEALKPHGVIVVVEAVHLCMAMRGISKPGSLAVTSAVRGLFKKDAAARAEALTLIKGE